jgi:hypothetical protein
MAVGHCRQPISGELAARVDRGGGLEQAGEVAHRFWGSERGETHRNRCSTTAWLERRGMVVAGRSGGGERRQLGHGAAGQVGDARGGVGRTGGWPVTVMLAEEPAEGACTIGHSWRPTSHRGERYMGGARGHVAWSGQRPETADTSEVPMEEVAHTCEAAPELSLARLDSRRRHRSMAMLTHEDGGSMA